MDIYLFVAKAWIKLRQKRGSEWKKKGKTGIDRVWFTLSLTRPSGYWNPPKNATPIKSDFPQTSCIIINHTSTTDNQKNANHKNEKISNLYKILNELVEDFESAALGFLMEDGIGCFYRASGLWPFTSIKWRKYH